MKTNSNLNKMWYRFLIEKLITSFRLKKKKLRLARFWEGYSAMNLSHEIATAPCKFINRFQMNCLVS